jgi:hypothetical protein
MDAFEMEFTNFPRNSGMAMLNFTKQAKVMTHCGIMNFSGREAVQASTEAREHMHGANSAVSNVLCRL